MSNFRPLRNKAFKNKRIDDLFAIGTDLTTFFGAELYS